MARRPAVSGSPRGAGRTDLATRWLGPTDYDIPRFSFASGAVVCLALLVALFAVPAAASAITCRWQVPASLAGGLAVGFAVAVMQFFHDSERGPVAAFWLVGCLLSAAVAAVLLVVFCGAA